MCALSTNYIGFKIKKRALLWSLILLISLQATGFSQIKFTIHATSTSATTITVTGSGSATTNGDGTSWSNSNQVNQMSGNSSFNFVNANLNSKTFNLTGDLQLTDGATPLNFSAIVLDDDGSGFDDFALNVGTTTAVASNTSYTLSGSATFSISGTATFGDMITGVYSGTFTGSLFGFSNFNTSDIIIEVLLGTPNVAPTATNVNFTGTLEVGQQLSGTYTWADTDNGDTESGSTYKWYRSDDNAGTNKTAISGATSQTYTMVAADAGKHISFEVTPNDGTTAGAAVESALQATNYALAAENSTGGASTIGHSMLLCERSQQAY